MDHSHSVVGKSSKALRDHARDWRGYNKEFKLVIWTRLDKDERFHFMIMLRGVRLEREAAAQTDAWSPQMAASLTQMVAEIDEESFSS